MLICVSFPATRATLSPDGQLCFSCDNVADAKDCETITTCGPHESCYTQRFLGTNLQQYYKLGCIGKQVCENQQATFQAIGKRDLVINSARSIRSSDDDGSMVLCMHCCNETDFCNNRLCGSSPSTNRHCLKCDDVLNPSDCNHVEECRQDENCFAHEAPKRTGNHEMRYDLACLPKRQCDAFERAYLQIGCIKCCNHTDYCNYVSCNGWLGPLRITSISYSITSGTLALTCHVTGYPPYTIVSWSFSKRDMKELNFHISPNQTVAIVNEYDSTKHDGLYTCTATNNHLTVSRDTTVP